MSKAAFRASDITRAIKAAKAAGMAVGRVEIDRDGKIVIVEGEPAKLANVSPLEAWRAEQSARAAQGVASQPQDRKNKRAKAAK